MAYKLFPLFCFLSSMLTPTSAGTLLGFTFDARKNSGASSPTETAPSYLNTNKGHHFQSTVLFVDHNLVDPLLNTEVPVCIHLSQYQPENLIKINVSADSWLNTSLLPFFQYRDSTAITITSSSSNSEPKQLLLLLPDMHSVHSSLNKLNLKPRAKVAVAFSLPFKNLNRKHRTELHELMQFIQKHKAFILVEPRILGETHTQIMGQISGLFTEITLVEELVQTELFIEKQMPRFSYRKLLAVVTEPILESKSFRHDVIEPPTTTSPTIPVTNPVTTPAAIPYFNPTPAIVTVPSTNPVTAATPTNPVTTPAMAPPITEPITNPLNPPFTVTTAPPTTNPITTYLSPPPVTVPITNPIQSPVTTDSPTGVEQTWCIAREGAAESGLQTALDYACGVGGADCSAIQQMGNCYIPNTLQSHASYAVNSYYQKKPVLLNCDFGGAAIVVNINPSTGSCIYQSSSSTAASSSSSVLNTNNPVTASTGNFGSEEPPNSSTSYSISTNLKPVLHSITLAAFFVIGKLNTQM